MTDQENDRAQLMRDKARQNNLFYYPKLEEIIPDPDPGRVCGTTQADQSTDTQGAV